MSGISLGLPIVEIGEPLPGGAADDIATGYIVGGARELGRGVVILP
jgi:hypothetical protein